MTRTVFCVKLNKQGEGLERIPWPGEIGTRVYENVSKEAWQQWLRHQTMLINENQLNPLDPKTREYISDQMEKYFFGEGAEMPEGYVPEE